MHVSLFVPGPIATVSGNYLYDRRMAEGLRSLGHAVQVFELDGRFPNPDQAAECSATGRRGQGRTRESRPSEVGAWQSLQIS